MDYFDLTWVPEGKPIGTVFAKDASAAKRLAPLPYRKHPSEISADPVPTYAEGLQRLLSLATDDRMKAYGDDPRRMVIQGVPANEDGTQPNDHYGTILKSAGWVFDEVRLGWNPYSKSEREVVQVTMHHRTADLKGPTN